MDKEKIGAMMVDDIIERYKASKEFEKDAIKFVKKEILYEINATCASVGDEFAGGNINDKERQARFLEMVAKCRGQQEMVNQIFEQVFGEESPRYRP